MRLVSSPIELTTAATDALLALECLLIGAVVWRQRQRDRWRVAVWGAVFGLMAAAAALGAVAHGLELPESVRAAFWKPLYLALGLLVALSGVGAAYDWRGLAAARRLLPWALATGFAFFALTEASDGVFILFILYEAGVMLAVLAVYAGLTVRHRLPGAGFMAWGLALNLVAAAVQASYFSLRLGGLPFDNNGIFHLIQMAAIAVFGRGLWQGLRPSRPAA